MSQVRIRQVMLMVHIRTGLVVAFAVMFGIVQLICACLPEVQSTNFIATQSQVSHHMSTNKDGQDHHSVVDISDQAAPSHDHDDHDHEVDCSDCDYTVILAVNVDLAPSVFTTPAVYQTSYLDFSPVTLADMAATNLAGLRWLDPPRTKTSPSPVLLKTRSLT